MNHSSPNIAVLGAGAIGCLYGLRLARQNSVVLLGRNPEKIRKMRDHGILLQSSSREERYFVDTGLSGTFSQQLPPMDLVLVTVKAHQLAKAVEENHALFLRGNPIVCLLMNGGDNPRFFNNLIPEERLVLAITTYNSMRINDTLIRHSDLGLTTVGPDTPNGNKVAGILREAGFAPSIDPDIRRSIWKKLFVNSIINPLTAIHGIYNRDLLDSSRFMPQIDQILTEAIRIARAEGYLFDFDEMKKHVLRIAENTGKCESSMLQDIRHKRLTEIDEINGTLVRLAQKHELPCTVNMELIRHIHLLEKQFTLE